jgi:inhibitor of KinA sporulation pathway (predicted exonuclease)
MSIETKLFNLQAIQNLLTPYRYLYCVDLEATCDEVEESESPRPLAVVPDQMETIEVDLVVIDLVTLEIVDEFQRFVRPQINPSLTDFCKKLTSIQQADADGARTYQEVGEELRMFAAHYPNAAWVSWGDYDARQPERDAGFAACPSLGTYHRGIDDARNVASIVKEMLS